MHYYRRSDPPAILMSKEILLGVPGAGSLLVAAPGQVVIVRGFEKGLRNERWSNLWSVSQHPQLASLHTEWGWDIWRLLALTAALQWKGEEHRVIERYVEDMDRNRFAIQAAVANTLGIDHQCPICGRYFPRVGRRVYCSDACKQVAYRLRR